MARSDLQIPLYKTDAHREQRTSGDLVPLRPLACPVGELSFVKPMGSWDLTFVDGGRRIADRATKRAGRDPESKTTGESDCKLSVQHRANTATVQSSLS